jgi:hypothetical protein
MITLTYCFVKHDERRCPDIHSISLFFKYKRDIAVNISGIYGILLGIFTRYGKGVYVT